MPSKVAWKRFLMDGLQREIFRYFKICANKWWILAMNAQQIGMVVHILGSTYSTDVLCICKRPSFLVSNDQVILGVWRNHLLFVGKVSHIRNISWYSCLRALWCMAALVHVVNVVSIVGVVRMCTVVEEELGKGRQDGMNHAVDCLGSKHTMKKTHGVD